MLNSMPDAGYLMLSQNRQRIAPKGSGIVLGGGNSVNKSLWQKRARVVKKVYCSWMAEKEASRVEAGWGRARPWGALQAF